MYKAIACFLASLIVFFIGYIAGQNIERERSRVRVLEVYEKFREQQENHLNLIRRFQKSDHN